MTTRSRRRFASGVVLALVLAACATDGFGGDETANAEPVPIPASDSTSEIEPSSTAPANTATTGDTVAPTDPAATSARPVDTAPVDDPPSTGEIPPGILEPVLAAAAERTGIAVGDLVVVRAEAVTWNDGSLGCPAPGQTYTMALVDGYRVEVDAGGELLDYRVGDRGTFKLCESGPSLSGAPDG